MAKAETEERTGTTPEPDQPDVERDVEDLPEAEELEELTNEELGLDDEYVLTLVASQRFNLARTYQANRLALQNLEASVTANKAVGNEKSVKEFEDRIAKAKPDVMHILRSIKAIDKAYPGAKAEMRKQVAKANAEQG